MNEMMNIGAGPLDSGPDRFPADAQIIGIQLGFDYFRSSLLT